MRASDGDGFCCTPLVHAPLRAAGSPLLLLRRLVPFLLSLLTACDTGPRTFSDVESGRVHLDAEDAAALRDLLAAAGLAPRQLDLDGELASGANWVEIDDDGHVRALGLTAAADLDSLTPLADLSWLSRVRIRGANLAALDGLAHAASLTHLTIVGSGVSSLNGLEGCRALRVLDLRDNNIESLDQLTELPRLRILDLAGNAISTVTNLTGREHLESLDLSGNVLTSVQGIEQLPSLERLNLARNQLTTMSGLRDLPRLRELFVDDNQLVDATAIDTLPALELVNLNGNRLEHFPQLVNRLAQHLWQDNPGFLPRLRERAEK